MSNFKNNKLPYLLHSINPQYFCLAAALGLEFLLMAFRGYGFYFIENYMVIPVMLFLGMAFGKKLIPLAQRQLWLSLVMVFWFFITQTMHYMMDMDVRSVGQFTSVYLLAFLFCSFTLDNHRQWGLQLAGIACIGAALMMVGFTALLVLDILPGFLRPHVVWDGARLQAFWHPNICAAIVMMGITFSIYFAAKVKKLWGKALLLAIVLVMFLVISLTNSRTSIFITCCIIGGTLFFLIDNHTCMRFLAGALVAAATILLLFNLSGAIFQFNNDRMVAQQLQLEATTSEEGSDEGASEVFVDPNTGKLALRTDAGQAPLFITMSNLNGRTDIWQTSLQVLLENPTVLLLGTDHSESLLSAYHRFAAAHAHNAWIETTLCLGLPGLVFALVFTLLAAWNVWNTFWSKQSDLGQRIIAMLVLCLLGAGILEPYLFFTEIFYHYTDFIFFLCLGYLIHWRSETSK